MTHNHGYPTDPAPQYTGPNYGPGYNPERNGLGLTALILAIVGLVFCLIPLTGFIGLILGVTALALGIAGRSRVKKNKATNGKTAVSAIVLAILAIAGGIWGITIVFGAVDELGSDLDCISDADTSAQIEACND